jgi:hypothetical protein
MIKSNCTGAAPVLGITHGNCSVITCCYEKIGSVETLSLNPYTRFLTFIGAT